jgi:hypothetical protein
MNESMVYIGLILTSNYARAMQREKTFAYITVITVAPARDRLPLSMRSKPHR